MEANRESLISFKSGNITPENAKFKLCIRADIGTEKCNQTLEKIKAMGITPANNVVVIEKDFENEEGAKKVAPLLDGFKAQGMLGPATELTEPVKVIGANCIVPIRLPPPAVAVLSMLHAVNDAIGDIASKQQFVEFCISEGRTIKEILSDQTASPIAAALSALSIQFKLSTQKEFPVKLCNFIAGMAPSEEEKGKIKLFGDFLGAFHHVKLEVDIAEPGEALKQAFKNEMLMGLMGMAQMGIMMGTQFGILDVAKQGKGLTKAYLCLSPLVAVEFTLDAPTALEALESLAPPSPPPS